MCDKKTILNLRIEEVAKRIENAIKSITLLIITACLQVRNSVEYVRTVLLQFLQRQLQATGLAQNHVLIQQQLAVLEVVVARLNKRVFRRHKVCAQPTCWVLQNSPTILSAMS